MEEEGACELAVGGCRCSAASVLHLPVVWRLISIAKAGPGKE
jgi:hypothetical protein